MFAVESKYIRLALSKEWVCSSGDTFQLPPAVESDGRHNVNQLMRGTKNEKMKAKWCVRKVCAHQKVYILLKEEAKGQTEDCSQMVTSAGTCA